jgi:hypothetical protein
MHQIIATFFSLLIALCHHTSLSARPVEAAEISPSVLSASSTAVPSMILPDRYQLARYTSADGSYAEAACVSCRRTDGSSSDR